MYENPNMGNICTKSNCKVGNHIFNLWKIVLNYFFPGSGLAASKRSRNFIKPYLKYLATMFSRPHEELQYGQINWLAWFCARLPKTIFYPKWYCYQWYQLEELPGQSSHKKGTFGIKIVKNATYDAA